MVFVIASEPQFNECVACRAAALLLRCSQEYMWAVIGMLNVLAGRTEIQGGNYDAAGPGAQVRQGSS